MTLPSTDSVDNQLHKNTNRIHLHDTLEQNQFYPMTKEALMDLVHCIPNEDLRQAIQIEIKKLVSDYEHTISVLEQRSDIFKQEYESLRRSNEENSQRKYEKAVREMQFFKKKFDKAHELNKQYMTFYGPLTPANRPLSPSFDNSTVTSFTDMERSVYSLPLSPAVSSMSGATEMTHGSLYHQFSPLPPPPAALPTSPPPTSPPLPQPPLSTMMDTKPRHMSTFSSSTNSSNSCLPNSTELPPVLRMRKDSTNTVGVASSIHSASTEDSKSSIYSTATSTASRTNDPIIQQRKVDPIAFGGSDALWDTIISNKTQDTTIEKMISNFLRRGGSPNTAKQSSSNKMIKYGYGMLHAMIAIKASAFMNILLQQGANPNAMTLSQVEEDKVTPGYLAASMGWILGLQALVEAGADLTQAKGAGLKNKTALHVAVENCHTTVVEYIVSLTPPKYHSQVDSMGASALHYAALTGHTDLVNYLIQTCQLQTDLQDLRGETPLHWASRQGHLEVASLLIERCGCDFNAYVPRKIGTPYDLAKASGHKRLLDYYKKIGALTAKKMDRKREEEMEKQTPAHLEFALTKNGLFDF